MDCNLQQLTLSHFKVPQLFPFIFTFVFCSNRRIFVLFSSVYRPPLNDLHEIKMYFRRLVAEWLNCHPASKTLLTRRRFNPRFGRLEVHSALHLSKVIKLSLLGELGVTCLHDSVVECALSARELYKRSTVWFFYNIPQ